MVLHREGGNIQLTLLTILDIINLKVNNFEVNKEVIGCLSDVKKSLQN
jgi:hypothetical protein